MHIFIDESGSFVRPQAGRNLSCVGALVVPDGRLQVLTRKFRQLVARWKLPEGEVKGRTLNEAQVAAVITLLFDARCYFFVGATEMSVNEPSTLREFQDAQARFLTENITSEHSAEVREQAFGLRALYEQMAPQLFVQGIVLYDVVKRVIDLASLRFALRGPAREAGAFHWVIDAKSAESRTSYEHAWQLLAGPVLQYQTLMAPGIRALEGDYRYFDRSFSRSTNSIPSNLPPRNTRCPGRPGATFNLKKVLYESMEFADSALTPGLQLADIVTNAFRRALMGRLRPAGFHRLGELMLSDNGHPVALLRFNSSEETAIPEYVRPYELIARRARAPDSP
jgi:Protein of unknown function (DUF3800)